MKLKKLVALMIGFIVSKNLYLDFIDFIEDSGYTKDQVEETIQEVNN